MEGVTVKMADDRSYVASVPNKLEIQYGDKKHGGALVLAFFLRILTASGEVRVFKTPQICCLILIFWNRDHFLRQAENLS